MRTPHKAGGRSVGRSAGRTTNRPVAEIGASRTSLRDAQGPEDAYGKNEYLGWNNLIAEHSNRL